MYASKGETIMARKLTRKQKIKMNPQGSGRSKYALKIAKRRREAVKLGLPENTPYPIIKINR